MNVQSVKRLKIVLYFFLKFTVRITAWNYLSKNQLITLSVCVAALQVSVAIVEAGAELAW